MDQPLELDPVTALLPLIDNLQPGAMVFDIFGEPLGVVSEVTADEFRTRRRGTVAIKGDVIFQNADGTWGSRTVDLNRGRIVGTKDGYAMVEIGEPECEESSPEAW